MDSNVVTAPAQSSQGSGLDYGMAYTRLRDSIESLVAKLGGDHFARVAVTVGAREALGQVMPSSWQRGYATTMSFCEALTATPAQLQAATERLERMLSVRPEAVSLCGSLGHGRLVVRGHAMYFETGKAAAIFAHYYVPYGDPDQWTVALTSEAEAYIAEHRMQRPSVGMSHTKSEEAARKSLVRMAKQHFGVKLEKPLGVHDLAA